MSYDIFTDIVFHPEQPGTDGDESYSVSANVLVGFIMWDSHHSRWFPCGEMESAIGEHEGWDTLDDAREEITDALAAKSKRSTEGGGLIIVSRNRH